MLPDKMTLFELLLYARLGFDDFATDVLDNHYMISSLPSALGRYSYNSSLTIPLSARERIVNNLSRYIQQRSVTIEQLSSNTDNLNVATNIINNINSISVNALLTHIDVEKIKSPSLTSHVTIFAYVSKRMAIVTDGDTDLSYDSLTKFVEIPITLSGYNPSITSGGDITNDWSMLEEYGISKSSINIAGFTTLNIDLNHFNGDFPSYTIGQSAVMFDVNSMRLVNIPTSYNVIYNIMLVNYINLAGSEHFASVFTNLGDYVDTGFDMVDYWRNENVLPTQGLNIVPTMMSDLEQRIITHIQQSLDTYLNTGEDTARIYAHNVYYEDYYTRGNHLAIIDIILKRARERTLVDMDSILRITVTGNNPMYNDMRSRLTETLTNNFTLWNAIDFIENKFSFNQSQGSVTTTIPIYDGVQQFPVDITIRKAIYTCYTSQTITYIEFDIIQSFLTKIWDVISDMYRAVAPLRDYDVTSDFDVLASVDYNRDNTFNIDDSFINYDDEDEHEDDYEPQEASISERRRYFTINSYHSSSMRTNVGGVSHGDFLSLPDEKELFSGRDYIGLELEFAHSYEDDVDEDDITDYANNAFYNMCRDDIGSDVLKHFDFSRDSSLEGRGAEMVSLPMTLAYIKSKREMFDHMFTHMRNEGMMSLGGFHIHVGREFVYENMRNEDAVDTANALFDILFYDDAVIDERSPYGRARYNLISTYILGRFANDYCEKNLGFKDVYYRGGNHRNWINKSSHTVEFRMPSMPFNTDDLFLKLDYIIEGIGIIKRYLTNKDTVSLDNTIRALRLHNIKFFKRKITITLADYKKHNRHQPNNTHISLTTLQRSFVYASKAYDEYDYNDVVKAYTTFIYVADALNEGVVKNNDLNGRIEMVWNSVGELIKMGVIEL